VYYSSRPPSKCHCHILLILLHLPFLDTLNRNLDIFVVRTDVKCCTQSPKCHVKKSLHRLYRGFGNQNGDLRIIVKILTPKFDEVYQAECRVKLSKFRSRTESPNKCPKKQRFMLCRNPAPVHTIIATFPDVLSQTIRGN
jgi:hypothetical protein